MKKLLLSFVLLFSWHLVIAAPSVIKPPKKKVYAADIIVPLGPSGMKISLLDMSKLTVKEAEEIRGEKMKTGEKIAFKVAQRQLKKTINPDGTINDKRLAKNLKKAADGEGFHVGGFLLGLLLGLIGVIIALLINDDLKRSRVKWSLIGWAVWIAIVLLAFVL